MSRLAFALVELLVVLAVIGVMAALLLPAVQAARETSRRCQCASHLRQIGMALHQFHDVHRALPASGWTQAGPGNPAGRFIGWRALVLPYVEQANTAARYNPSLHWWEGENLVAGTQLVPTYVCPSVPVHAEVRTAIAKPPRPALMFPAPLAPANYEAIMGVQPSVDPLRYGSAGSNRSAMFRNSQVNFAEIHDGTSQTLLIVECASRPLVYRRRALLANMFNDQGHGWIDSEGGFSLDGSSADGSLQGLGPLVTPVAVNATNFNEPYAFHPVGANVLFADGHVLLVSQSVELLTFAALCTRQAEEVVDLSSR
jgi:prepilin-type processing-associated H-X9-DG protein